MQLYFRVLLHLFFETIQFEESAAPSKRIRDLIILMRSLIISPDILQPSFEKNTMFKQSASAFYEAYLQCAEENSYRFLLLRLVFVDFKQIVSDCPPEYVTIPQPFISSLANVMYVEK